MLDLTYIPLEALKTCGCVKRPIVVRAVQINVGPWKVQTSHGIAEAKAGDWLLIGPDGERYPCAKETFDKTYSLVSVDTPVRVSSFDSDFFDPHDPNRS